MRLILVAGLAHVGWAQTCIQMNNAYDTIYTVGIGLGTPPQVLQAVPDTGSFEVLAASTTCEDDCGGGNHTLFSPSTSSTMKYSDAGDNATVGTFTSYGQGEVLSILVADQMSLGDLVAPHVEFLLMLRNALKSFDTASYDAVMGIGPLVTATVPGEEGPHEKPRPSLMTQMNATVVSICLGQSAGSSGRLDLHGGVPGLLYEPLPVAGKIHWGLAVNGVSVRGDQVGHCDHPPHCAAIVDSGTSLITLPKHMINALKHLTDSVKTDCSNVDELPPLVFHVSGRVLTIPPQLWVLRMVNMPLTKEASYELPGYDKTYLPFYTGEYGDECVAALDEMDVTTDHGPMMILGLPFLRAYATVFNRTNDTARTLWVSEMPLNSDQCAGCSVLAHAERKRASLAALQPEQTSISEGAEERVRSISPAQVRRPWHARTARHREEGKVFLL